MRRRAFLQVTAASAIGAAASRARAEAPTNLLFLMCDQLRWDALACAGNPVVATPALDRLAREGARFAEAHTYCPICVPARSVMLTGLTTAQLNVTGNGDYDAPDLPRVPTFDSVLAGRGYRAEYYGKWHAPYQLAACYGNRVRQTGKHSRDDADGSELAGYAAWLAANGVKPRDPAPGELLDKHSGRPYRPIALDENYANRNAADPRARVGKNSGCYGCLDLPAESSRVAFAASETLRALERLAGEPFSLTCSFGPPHPPMLVTEPWFSRHAPDTLPLPRSLADPMTHSPYRERAATMQPYRDPANIRAMRAIYFGLVEEIDHWVGRILDRLDALGLAQRTLVVFTADHGEMLGDHGMQSKMVFYDGAQRVPLLLRLPGAIAPGTVVPGPVSMLDIGATIVDYLGASGPSLGGASLRSRVEGKSAAQPVVAEWRGGSTPAYMVRAGDYKLMMGSRRRVPSVDALYNLREDPDELTNLLAGGTVAAADRQVARELRDQLVAWLRATAPSAVASVVEHEL